MQDFQSTNDSMISLDFSDEKSQPAHTHSDIELFYVLQGEIRVQTGESEFLLRQDDFIIINSNTEHSHWAASDVLYASFFINYYKLCQRLGANQVILSCHSALEKNRPSYIDVQSIIQYIFNQYSQYPNSKVCDNFLLTALYYRLLSVLINNFRVLSRPSPISAKEEADETRIDKIQSFIQNNYKAPITLDELARTLFLSPAYLSKYIRKHFQMNYMSLLNSIRLSSAVDDIKTTDKSITRVSQDNGFPNMSSFNRLFKAKYGATPSAFAAKIRSQAPKSVRSPKTSSDLTKRVHKYFESHFPDTTLGRHVVCILADTEKRQRYLKSWSRMINIGPLSDLLIFDMGEQLLTMRKELGFEYVRFSDLYASIMFLENGKSYNFTKLDRLFDFFVNNDMRPYIELGFKPVLVLRSAGKSINFIVSRQREILFKSPAEYEYFLSSFIKHYSNRFGLEEVEKWFFEQWIDPRQAIREEDYRNYFEMFEAAYHALKSLSPNIRIGGGGLSIYNSDSALNAYLEDKNSESSVSPQMFSTTDDHLAFLNAWRKRPCHPDFFSMYSYPYNNTIGYIQNHTSMKEQALSMRAAIEDAGFTIPEFHISEWSFTVSDRNTLNDSCFKSAYIIKNALENMQLVDVMGYWYASDLVSEFTDTDLILNGSGGLISTGGIKKPAYFAFDFLNRMEKYLLCNEEHCAITSNGRDSYTIICHNYRKPNFRYALKAEDKIGISEHKNLFESNEKIRLQFQIKNVKNGDYLIRTYSLNDANGSVQSEWVKLGLLKNMNKEDIDYLKRICTPRITIKSCTVKDNTLMIDTVLDVQEIQYIHLTYNN